MGANSAVRVRRSVARDRALEIMAMALVACLSFSLLLYVGFGEAQRSFERFHLDKLAAQGRMLQAAIESYLRRDLPLSQYVGFRARAERLRASDDQILTLAVYDADGKPLFVNGDAEIGLLPVVPAASRTVVDAAEVRSDRRHLQLVLPLANRYERVGSLVLTIDGLAIDEEVWGKFEPLLYLAGGLSLLFGLAVGIGRILVRRPSLPWLHIPYAGLFLVMAGGVITSMVQLYNRGAQLEAKALADSLGYRMTEIVGFNLDLHQLQGLDRAFGEYRRLNPDIGAVALLVDGRIAIHTDPFMVGRPWKTDASTYEYRVDVTPPDGQQRVEVAVTLPEDIVYGRVFHNAKNFLALFVASAFLANLFLQLAGTIHHGDPPTRIVTSERALAFVKPVFYLAMCVEHLIYPFLPQYVRAELVAGGFSESLTGLVVTTYYLLFALTIVPAGYLSQRFGSRRVMTVGLVLTASGLLVLLLPGSLLPLVLGRAFAGIGQALLLIGVQSYILAVASPERRTQGAAIIVFGFQGGMIAGMAIGSLLVVNLGAAGVFALGAVVAAMTALYTILVLPAEAGAVRDESGLSASLSRLGWELGQALRSRGLLATMGFVGLPAKAVLTGVVVFALPLLMTEHGYRHEDIGQMLMIYAGGVIVAGGAVARLVDRRGRTGMVLGIGGFVSGVGLLVIATADTAHLGHGSYAGILQTVMLVIGILVVGGAHGLINAPIVTHVAELDLARRIGAGAATATYRFLERIGHVAGPALVGQLLSLTGQIGLALQGIAIVVAILGCLFLLLQRRTAVRNGPDTPNGRLLGIHLDPPNLAFLMEIEGETPTLVDRPGRVLRAATRANPDPPGSAEAGPLERFLAPILADLPAGSRLRLVGCGDGSVYEAVARRAPMIELRTVTNPAWWLEELRALLLQDAEGLPGRLGPMGSLARALAEHGRDPHRGKRPFVWIRSASPERRPTLEPVVSA